MHEGGLVPFVHFGYLISHLLVGIHRLGARRLLPTRKTRLSTSEAGVLRAWQTIDRPPCGVYTCMPMKPAAPVTSTFMNVGLVFGWFEVEV
jgi:hypothetical protein